MLWSLIARIEAGDIDDLMPAQIATAIAGLRPYVRDDDPPQWDAWKRAEQLATRALRGSLDAVINLLRDGWTWGLDATWRSDIPILPDGWSWASLDVTGEPRALCNAYVAGNDVVIAEARGVANPSRALLIAILKAIARD